MHTCINGAINSIESHCFCPELMVQILAALIGLEKDQNFIVTYVDVHLEGIPLLGSAV